MQMPIYFIYVCIAQWKFLKFKFVRELENWLQWLQVDEEFIFTGKRHGGGGERGGGFHGSPASSLFLRLLHCMHVSSQVLTNNQSCIATELSCLEESRMVSVPWCRVYRVTSYSN